MVTSSPRRKLPVVDPPDGRCDTSLRCTRGTSASVADLRALLAELLARHRHLRWPGYRGVVTTEDALRIVIETFVRDYDIVLGGG